VKKRYAEAPSLDQPATWAPQSADAAINEFLSDYEQGSPKTLLWYRDQVGRAFRGFLERQGIENLEAVSPALLRLYLQDQRATGLGDKSMVHRYTSMRRLFGWCCEQGYLTANPAMRVKRPAEGERLRKGFDGPEVEAIMKAVSNAQRKRNWIGLRDRALITVLIDTGMRSDELLGVEVDHIEWQQHLPVRERRPHIVVRRKGNRDRLMPIGKRAQEALRAYLRERPRLPVSALWLTLYGDPLNYQALRLMLRRLEGLSGVENIECHRFRHTYAVALYMATRDMQAVKSALDHKHIQTTDRYLRGLGMDFHLQARYPNPADWLT